MKAVVLAGGRGSRLLPVTRAINKHLLPVFDRPMIEYPLELLSRVGVDEVLVVTGPEHIEAFRSVIEPRPLGHPAVAFAEQPTVGGVADALRYAEDFSSGQPLCVALGDNLFGDDLSWIGNRFTEQGRGARVVLGRTDRAADFGVAEFGADAGSSDIERIHEKPVDPPSEFAVLGLYFYDGTVFDRLRELRPSTRGEVEITDLNNSYAADGELQYDIIDGWWSDAGTPESLLAASNHVAEHGANGRPIGSRP